LCIGLPGVAQTFEQYFALSEVARGDEDAPWQLAALAVGAWANMWSGRREPVKRAMERGEALHQKFGSMRLVSERLLQFRALYLGAIRQFDAAEALMKMLIGALNLPEAASHRAVWLRAYQHGLARLYWLAGDYDKFRALAATLLAPRSPSEWPFIESAGELVRGQLALLQGNWREAEAALERSARLHERYRMPMSYGDPRITLACVHLRRGSEAAAWQAFNAVWREVVDDQALGLLLLEPKHIVAELLSAMPAVERRTSAYEAVMARLGEWHPQAAEVAVPAGPLAALTEREHGVLERVAAGASNKHIARELELSLHTVKRHLANILDKLDCASRGQAADLYRRTR
jgi:LuxR family maltose regulon positive regulatory protein